MLLAARASSSAPRSYRTGRGSRTSARITTRATTPTGWSGSISPKPPTVQPCEDADPDAVLFGGADAAQGRRGWRRGNRWLGCDTRSSDAETRAALSPSSWCE